MSDFAGTPVAPPAVHFGLRRYAPARGFELSQGGGPSPSTITYCYITDLGVRGTTTSVGSIPAGAYIERIVRS